MLFEFLQSDIGIRMLEGLQTGTTVKLLNNSQLERLEVPMYDVEFMNKIGCEIRRNKLEYQNKIKETQMMFEERRKQLIRALRLNTPVGLIE